MGETIDKMFGLAEQVADTAATTTMALVAMGKGKMDTYSLKNRLAKAERRLGQLVYTQQKTGEENPDLIALHVQEIDRVRAELDRGAPTKSTVSVVTCPSCDTGVKKDAIFCSCCGHELSQKQSNRGF